MYEVKLSSKNQIVIPSEARDALGVKAGNKILIVVRGDNVILLRKPGKYSQSIRGIAKGLYQPAYVAKERESWK
jgi:AbrB family looped-hinge helix DNA binding protein